MFDTQSTVNGHISAKQNVFLPPQVKIMLHHLIHIPPLGIEQIRGKWVDASQNAETTAKSYVLLCGDYLQPW